MSAHGDDDTQRIEVKSGRCRLSVDIQGDIVFLDDETGVARMPHGSHLEIYERIDGVRRRIGLQPGVDGRPEIDWEVDGRSVVFDSAAQEWLATMIPRIFRMTGLDAEQRVGRILRTDGVDALFEEVRLIGGDHVQRKYLVHLIAQAPLNTAELRQWLDVAGGEIGSDYELAETLGVFPAADLEQPEIQAAFVSAAASIGSDYEMRRTLQRLLDQDHLSAGLLEPLLASAGTIGSDYECAELLVGIARKFPEDELPAAYYEVAASIGSDYEMRRALTEVADRPMGEAALSIALEAATHIGSDYELAELLVRLIRRHGVSEGVRDDFEAALETIGSQHERGRVLEAWHRAEGS